MGVTQLWSVVQPCARPIKIETLNKKRLAVDSSLWIYQFLKAVRDKEGNALRNSHVVGFYRRICKLLYLGIKPVFVFDGGAPALKRQTIAGRKSRREGRREDAARTAGKLLALQMQRRAEEEAEREREQRQAAATGNSNATRQEEEVPDNPVYVDEIQMTQQERQQNRKFKKKDQYHLPDLDVSLAEMGQPNDPRVMSLEELEQYARQFDTGEEINVYDFSKIDFDSPFFQSLPPTDRYNILNAARLRSRLRMGLSKDQLDTMFPDRMAFSRFQIERVKERNELTQRLMHVNGMSDDTMFGVDGGGRVAGEKGREYVLVKNTGVEGGWALGVIGDSEHGERNKPIDVDEVTKPKIEVKEQSEDEGEDAFEDVPIEGLNRLPKIAPPVESTANDAPPSRDVLKRRDALYEARRQRASGGSSAPIQSEPDELDSLFISDPSNQNTTPMEDEPNSDVDDEDELQRAIAMSLENDGRLSSPEDDDFQEVFHADRDMSATAAPRQQLSTNKATAASSIPLANESDDEDEMVFENALADTKPPPPENSKLSSSKPTSNTAFNKFGGPLPFEKLDLGSSILGKKKMEKIEQDNAGGFEKNLDQDKKKKQPTTLPPWFSDDLISGLKAQDSLQKEDLEKDRKADEENFIFPEQPKLRKENSSAVIDVDALEEKDNVITVDSEDEKSPDPEDNSYIEVDTEVRMGDVADLARASPPETRESVENLQNEQQQPVEPTPEGGPTDAAKTSAGDLVEEDDDEPIEWEESDREEPEHVQTDMDVQANETAVAAPQPSHSRSPSLEFEEVTMEEAAAPTKDYAEAPLKQSEDQFQIESDEEAVPLGGAAEESGDKPVDEFDEEQYFSEKEDEELMNQLATEAEEHARFASTLNQKTTQQNIEEYERELKALRTQQKKDRRDADEVTQVMITECQQLLKLFGLPYITAPMEAEAQCAELVSLGLVDGIVTDDSDVFLFGGTRIYKNMFNQAKYVECYLSSDLEREFDLTRDKLIRIAHLLGSDYTEGLPGIGPVTALEIISEFPNGLDEFKDWWSEVQMGAKPSDIDKASAFRKKFRRNSVKLFLPPTFPDQRVDQAYLHPEVDSDPSAFQWGVPDLDALRSYLMATVGWSPERTDEVLVPVIRDMNRRENEGTQSNITGYIGGGGVGGAGAFAPRRRDVGKSKRMETALEKLAERAREKRKADAAADRAVQADEAVIAVQGSAVDGSPAGKQTRRQRHATNGAAKRKQAPLKDGGLDEVEANDEMSDDPPTKKNKTKSRRKAK